MLAVSIAGFQDPGRLPDEYVPTPKGPSLGKEPILEAKEIYLNRRPIGRGVTLLVPRTTANQRYFYSRSTVRSKEFGSSASTVESWSDRRGVPIRAVYTAFAVGKRTVTTLTRQGNVVVVEEAKDGTPTKARTIPLPKDLRFQFSQFHPMDVRDCADGQPAEFSVVDPIEGNAKRYRLSLKQTAQSLRYRMTAPGFSCDIETLPDGRLVRSEANSGLALVAVEPSRSEWEELEEKLRDRG